MGRLQEWLQLRAKGIKTPQIAIWQNLHDPTGNLWKAYVDGEYRDPKYEDIIFKDSKTGKKVFFTTANPNPMLVEAIESPNPPPPHLHLVLRCTNWW